MKHKISRQSIQSLFSELYKKWPHCNISVIYSDFDKALETNLTCEMVIKKVLNVEYTQLGFYIDEMKGFQEVRKIALDKEKCSGATFRYALSGWGLIIVKIKQIGNSFEIECSTNSEKRANAWYITYPELKDPNLWDWEIVRGTQRSIDRIIKKFAS